MCFGRVGCRVGMDGRAGIPQVLENDTVDTVNITFSFIRYKGFLSVGCGLCDFRGRLAGG